MNSYYVRRSGLEVVHDLLEEICRDMSRSRNGAHDEPDKEAVLYPVVRLCLSVEDDRLHTLLKVSRCCSATVRVHYLLELTSSTTRQCSRPLNFK